MKALVVIELNAPHRLWESALPVLRDRGVDPVLATLQGFGGLHDSLNRLGIASLALDCSSVRDYPRAVARIARYIVRHDVDLVHGCESIPATIASTAGIMAGRGTRVFHRQHSELGPPTRWFAQVAFRLSHLTMACSEAAARWTIEHGVPAEKVRVAYNGVPDPRPVPAAEIAALRQRLGIEPHARVVVAVARLRPEKGLDDLLAAAGKLHDDVAPAHTVVVGDGPDRGRLQALAGSLEGAATHFVGHQSDVSPWYHLADVVAMPSHFEAFGFSAVEAMACGKPLVATRVGGLVEIVDDGVTGLLVDPRSPDQLAATIARLLDQPGTAQRMGGAARASYESRFTIDATVSGWLSSYAVASDRRRASVRSDLVVERP